MDAFHLSSEAFERWKADSEELRRLQRVHGSTSSRLEELERLLAAQKREKEEAEARERPMAVRYKD